jgi:hypothetical protein
MLEENEDHCPTFTSERFFALIRVIAGQQNHPEPHCVNVHDFETLLEGQEPG